MTLIFVKELHRLDFVLVGYQSVLDFLFSGSCATVYYLYKLKANFISKCVIEKILFINDPGRLIFLYIIILCSLQDLCTDLIETKKDNLLLV